MSGDGFLRNDICYGFGDETITSCVRLSDPDKNFLYPGSPSEVAEDCRFHHFTNTNGFGLTINFDHVVGVYSASVLPTANGSPTFTTPGLDFEAAMKNGWRPQHIFNQPFMDKGSCIIFRKPFALFVGIKTTIIEALRTRNIDCRPGFPSATP